jgi:hypothetical protein
MDKTAKKKGCKFEGALRDDQYSTTTINIKNSEKITKNREKGKEDKHEGKSEEKQITLTYCGKEKKCFTKLF